MHVVLLRDVRRGRVDLSCKQRRAHSARRQYLGAPIGRAHFGSELFQNADGALAAPGKRRAHPVDEEVDGALDHRVRNVLEAQAGGKRCEFGAFCPSLLASLPGDVRLPLAVMTAPK